MRIVKSEVERNPVGDAVIEGMRVAERVFLLEFEVALARRLAKVEKRQRVGVIVLQAIHETQDRHH